jgi:hypothetical protein
MIKISLKNILLFLQAEASIKANELYPLLEFIRIETTGQQECTIVRSSMNAWVFFKCACETEAIPNVFLISDRILKGFAAQLSPDADILIYTKGAQIYLKSGKQEIKHQVMDSIDFPKFPDKNITGVRTEIPAAVIKSIKIAMAYTKQLQYSTAFSFVALAPNGDVFGSNGDFIYLKSTTVALPNVLIDQEAAAILDSEKDYRYMDNESYYFFICGNVTFGFIKTEMNRIDYSPFKSAGDPEKYFLVKTDDIIKFCSLCLAAAKELAPIGKISDNLLSYFDSSFNIDVKVDIETGGTIPVKDYKFSVQYMRKMMAALPYKIIHFSPVGENLIAYSPEDPNYIGVFSGTFKN